MNEHILLVLILWCFNPNLDYNIRLKTYQKNWKIVCMTKISLIGLDKSHAILVANNKYNWMKEKSINISSSFDSIVYVLSNATKM
jgi:hypothetical protein